LYIFAFSKRYLLQKLFWGMEKNIQEEVSSINVDVLIENKKTTDNS
jgi:hypothetical protein